MATIRARLGWIVRGRDHTVAALDTLTRDLQSLQQKVADLDRAIEDLRRGQVDLGARQLDEFDRVRAAVAQATDDLTARVVATQQRVRALEGDA